MKLLDDATEALQYNRDLPQSALGQTRTFRFRQGHAVDR
jgi:hypothetical protein